MNLRIKHARKLGEQLNAKAVIVIVFDKNHGFGIASYGDTKDTCRRTGLWVDRLTDEIGMGLDGPDFYRR